MTDGELSAHEKRILTVINECVLVHTVDDLSRMVQGSLRELLPFEMMICGVGGVSPQGSYVHKLLEHDSALTYYKYYQDLLNKEGRTDSPLMRKWRETHEPVYYQSGRDDHLYPHEWVHLFQKHDMVNTIAHGVADLMGSFSSYFVFSRLPLEVGPKQAHLLTLLTPHLHLALSRALKTVPDYPWNLGATKKPLSERQREVLYWMHEGKTNWEIANILSLTEINVKYHADQIFLKLDVRNRVHAVAKGHELGLIHKPVK